MSRKLLLIFLCAVFIRTLFASTASLQSDGEFLAAFNRLDGYYEIAENLLAGNGFSLSDTPPIVPDSVRMPLYPLFLAGLVFIFKSYYAVLVGQIILGSSIALLAYRIAFQILARERFATIVALLLVLEPLSIYFSLTLISETFFTALFLAGITLFLDYWKNQHGRVLAYATGLLALATLVRPTTQFLPLLLILAVFFLAKGRAALAFRHSLIIAGVFLLVLTPWSIRNFMRFGNPALSVQYASVPYAYLIPSVLALEKNIGFEEAKQQFYDGEGGIGSIGDINLANAPFYKKRTAEILKEHPVGLLKSVGVTFLTFFTHDGYRDILRRFGLEPSIQLERPAFILLLESPQKARDFVRPLLASPALFVILGRIVWVLITLSFIAGAIHYLRSSENRAKGIFILLVILYFVLTTVAVGLSVNARFRFPVNALILIFAAYGAATLLPKQRISRSPDIPASPSVIPTQVEIQKRVFSDA